MKIIDKFLKFLNTDRNTFFTYILSVLAFYFTIDRLVELVLMAVTGMSATYWGPIQYTLALACPIFAFLFSCSSSFVKNDEMKISFLYIYIISLYIIGISMAVQWTNALCWLLFMSSPGYVSIVTDLSFLIRPAFQSLAIYLPLITFYPLFKWIYFTVNDTNNIRLSIGEFSGIKLSGEKELVGAYACEMPFSIDSKYGKTVRITEVGRFQSTLVCGISGSGKTSLLFEPMMAKDIEKKFFFREVSKELGYAALKHHIAILNCPYDNDYLNKNFNLNMLTPSYGKESAFKALFNKMILHSSGDKYIYRDLGLTSISPDYESTSRILNVAKNYNMKVNLIDPNNSESIGLNPFIFDDPIKIALIISSVLNEMLTKSGINIEIGYKYSTAIVAIENLCILLKEMYPRLHDGDLPTLEDMLKMLNDFSLVESMCKDLTEIPELEEKYAIQIGYFKKNFYSDAIYKKNTEEVVRFIATQLETLLRVEGVKNILCNRHYNLNYDNVLKNGEITLLCTRRGDLGSAIHTAFGLFFILLMQYSVLRRRGSEKTRIPHFLYIDEFSDFVTHATTNMFTLYRKYRVGLIISIQNLSQLNISKDSKHKDTILSNCYNKFVFGNNSMQDNEWWSKELGEKREWSFGFTYNTDKVQYDQKYGNPKLEYKLMYAPGKIQSLSAKSCFFKIKNTGSKYHVGQLKLNYLASKYNEKHDGKQFNFSKYTLGNATSNQDEEKNNKTKFDLKNINFDSDPIKANSTDIEFEFDNQDAIIYDLKKKKN